jgi:pimeloyl-ACP methyl ester carboxylesterase
MLPLAEAGYYVVAPDLRGYGRTTGWDGDYDGDVDSFCFFNLVTDMLALVFALGYRSVHVAGHDFGSPLSAWCALIRPDVFTSVVLMSAPFGGAPSLPFDTADGETQRGDGDSIHDDLAALDRPRKHYQRYYSTREADDNMRNCPQGIHDFFRAYYHYKSADWAENKPFELDSWIASEIAKMPAYYVMDLEQGMAETVAQAMPSAEEIASCKWLSDEELRVYSSEFERNGFQGGFQWYRCGTSGKNTSDLKIFSGRTIDVPSCFIGGVSDWGVYQRPGNFETMQNLACTQMRGVHLVDGAGHWVQQEQPEEVSEILVDFLDQVNR